MGTDTVIHEHVRALVSTISDGKLKRGSTYQVWISSGYDPVTGRQLFLAGSADAEDAAIVLRDRLRQRVRTTRRPRRTSRLATCSMSGQLFIKLRRPPARRTGCSSTLHPSSSRRHAISVLCRLGPRGGRPTHGPMPGAVRVLVSNRPPLAIVSNNSTVAIHAYLDLHNLRPYVAHVSARTSPFQPRQQMDLQRPRPTLITRPLKEDRGNALSNNRQHQVA
jgi:hypothetical protein